MKAPYARNAGWTRGTESILDKPRHNRIEAETSRTHVLGERDGLGEQKYIRQAQTQQNRGRNE